MTEEGAPPPRCAFCGGSGLVDAADMTTPWGEVAKSLGSRDFARLRPAYCPRCGGSGLRGVRRQGC